VSEIGTWEKEYGGGDLYGEESYLFGRRGCEVS